MAGESGETIAVDLGLSHWRVYGFLRERGVLRTLSEACALREARRRRAAPISRLSRQRKLTRTLGISRLEPTVINGAVHSSTAAVA